MTQKENIFRFNHIDKNKTKEEIQEIKELYNYYHYKYWCHRQAFKHFKKLNLAINISSTGLISNWSCCWWFDGQPGHSRKHIRCWFSS